MNSYYISPVIKNLADIFYKQRDFEPLASRKTDPRIKIHKTVGRFAYIYEKIRVAIDYQEEHLIRKNAIGRMLKRRLTMKERGDNIVLPLIRELIRAGYLPNDYFPEARLADIERILFKYIRLINLTANANPLRSDKKTLNWIISVAAAEMEEYLKPTIRDDALVETMYKIMRPSLDISEQLTDEQDQNIQIYIAIHRALIKSDAAILRYHLLYYYTPEWRNITEEEISAYAERFPRLMEIIDKQINSKISDRLFRYIKKFGPYFVILKDVIKKNINNIDSLLADPRAFHQAIARACQSRYSQANDRLSRGIIRSIIYIFLTKTILAFIVELPYEAIFLKEFKLMPLAINVIFHPALMFIIAFSIRIPAEQNTQQIIKGINEIVYDLPEKEVWSQREERLKTSTVLNILFSLFYFVAFGVTFGAIIWTLITLEFSIASILLFLFFLSAISFFGIRLRHNAQELIVISKKQNLLIIIFDFFTLPIIRVGSWLAKKTSKVNVFMFIMDFIIEAPFKLLIETVEDWIAFQRQKKEEII